MILLLNLSALAIIQSDAAIFAGNALPEAPICLLNKEGCELRAEPSTGRHESHSGGRDQDSLIFPNAM
jgi:hypothetical protein